jgi:hypothetical protein
MQVSRNQPFGHSGTGGATECKGGKDEKKRPGIYFPSRFQAIKHAAKLRKTSLATVIIFSGYRSLHFDDKYKPSDRQFVEIHARTHKIFLKNVESMSASSLTFVPEKRIFSTIARYLYEP